MPNEAHYPRYRHVVFTMVWISQFMMVIAFLGHYVLTNEFIKDPLLSLTPSQLGWVLSVGSLMNAIVSVPMGMLIDHIGYRKLVTVAILGCGLSLILRGLSTNFPMFLFFTALTGVFFSVDYPTKVIGSWYPHKERGTAFSIFWLSWLGGTLIMAITWPFLMPLQFIGYSWRNLYYFVGILVAAPSILWWVLVRDSPEELEIERSTGKKVVAQDHMVAESSCRADRQIIVKLQGDLERPRVDAMGMSMLRTLKACLKNRSLWVVSILRLLLDAVYYGFWAYLFMWHSSRGMDPVAISAIFAIRPLSAPIYLWIGFISDKLGKRKPFIIASAAILTVSCFTLAFQGNYTLLLVSSVLFGVGYSVPSVMLYLLPVEIEDIGPPLAGTASGLNSFFANIGAWMGPLSGGYILESIGTLDSAYWLYTTFPLVFACIATLFLKETGRR